MKVTLFINYYIDKNPERQKEIDECFIRNLSNKEIDKFVILGSPLVLNDFKAIYNELVLNDLELKNKVTYSAIERRPTFNDYFIATSVYQSAESWREDLNIIANSDMFFDEDNILKLKSWHWNGKFCMALCRYDVISLNPFNYEFFNRPDAQDVWVFKGSVARNKEANFTMGVAGCDNVIARILSEQFEVLNPSLDIKSFHLHLTNVRNYISHTNYIERLPPPYLVIHPIHLP